MTDVTVDWICVDDGLGRYVYFLSSDGHKSSQEPPNFAHKYFYNGDQVYYFRGVCVSCKRKMIPSVFSCKSYGMAFALNTCDNCLKKICGLSKLIGNGDIIWDRIGSSPKTVLMNLLDLSLDLKREKRVEERAMQAKLRVAELSKIRRNQIRINLCKMKAAPYNITKGEYLSWGYGEVYDEYLGGVNSSGQPTGVGIKFYSDGSVYVGGWTDGRHHTDRKGYWTRPDGSVYEGNWLQGRKHGKGEQVYEDGRVYIGEWAAGVEHGHGKIQYPNGDIFEGRFRFGRRDGPGILKKKNGPTERGNFRDPQVSHEKAVPEISESMAPNPMNSSPPSLLQISLEALGNSVIRSDKKVPHSKLISKRCPGHLKPLLGHAFLSAIPNASQPFVKFGPTIAYLTLDVITLSQIPMDVQDIEGLIRIIEANTALTKLQIISAKLQGASIEMLIRNIQTNLWPNLTSIDFSCNKIELRVLQTIVDGISSHSSTIRHLKLSACHIKIPGVEILANLIAMNAPLQDLDLSFNDSDTKGAEALAKSLRQNTNLTSLNIRQNGIGPEGGMALAEVLKDNYTLKQLVISDNKLGANATAAVVGRLHTKTKAVLKSWSTNELVMPELYNAGRYGVLSRDKK